MRKALGIVLPLAVVALAGALLLWPEAEVAAKADVGEPAPDFTLKDQAGKAHKLSEYRGKIVVLEWTNPRCPFVQRHYEEDTMEELAEAFGGGDVVWLAVNSSHFTTPEASRKWMEEQGLGYPTLQDPKGTVGRDYGAKTTPHMFVIDAEGVLRYTGAIDNDPRGREEGDAETNYVRKALEALRSGRPPEPASTKPYGCSVKYD